MWKPLLAGQPVCAGDRIRFSDKAAPLTVHEKTFTVVKTDQHYFQLAPPDEEPDRSWRMKIVKYFEVDYYYKLEIWID